MADKNKIDIEIGTTGDTSGVDKVEKSMGKLDQSQVRIIDTSGRKSRVLKEAEDAMLGVAKAGSEIDQSNVRIVDSTRVSSAAVKENREEFAEWQKVRRAAAREAGTSRLAVDPARAFEEEVAIKRVTEAQRELNNAVGNDDAGSTTGITRRLREAARGARGFAAVLGGPLSRAASALAAGPIGVLTAGIGLAILAFQRLREKSQESADAMKDPLQDLQDRLKAFSEIEEAINESRKKAISDAREALTAANRGIGMQSSLRGSDAEIKAAQTLAGLNRETLQERIRLAEVERDIVFATGEAAARLAVEREVIIQRILDKEMEINEAAREREKRAAQEKVTTAEARVDATKDSDAEIFAQYQDALGRERDLQKRAADLTQDRLNTIQFHQAELAKLKPLLADANRRAAEDITGTTSAGAEAVQFSRQIQIAEKQIDGSRIASPEEVNALTERLAAAKALEEIQPELKASAAAQQQAADALTQARIDLAQLTQTQQIERQGEQDERAAETRITNIQQERKTQGPTVDSVNQVADAFAESGDANAKAAAEVLRSFTANNELSAEQLEKIPPIIDRFTNQVTALVPDLIDVIKKAQADVKELEREVQNLKREAAK